MRRYLKRAACGKAKILWFCIYPFDFFNEGLAWFLYNFEIAIIDWWSYGEDLGVHLNSFGYSRGTYILIFTNLFTKIHFKASADTKDGYMPIYEYFNSSPNLLQPSVDCLIIFNISNKLNFTIYLKFHCMYKL